MKKIPLERTKPTNSAPQENAYKRWHESKPSSVPAGSVFVFLRSVHLLFQHRDCIIFVSFCYYWTKGNVQGRTVDEAASAAAIAIAAKRWVAGSCLFLLLLFFSLRMFFSAGSFRSALCDLRESTGITKVRDPGADFCMRQICVQCKARLKSDAN